MLDLIEPTGTAAATAVDTLWADVAEVCRRIPPLWDLENFVAVNPFLGFSDWPMAEAARAIGDGLGAAVLPGYAFYRQRWAAGAFGRAEIEVAAARAGLDPDMLEKILDGRAAGPRRFATLVPTLAERLDRRHGTAWNTAVVSEIARWCAFHLSGGGTYWRLPADGRSLFAAWREAASVDRSIEIAGLKGWRRWIARLPDSAEAAIPALLGTIDVPAGERVAYLYRLLGTVYGWASFLRRSSWQDVGTNLGPVVDLLAMRLAADAAVAALAPRDPSTAARGSTIVEEVENESIRLAFQDALEAAFTRGLVGRLRAPAPGEPVARPAVQAVFCIDVRSEPFRRHLEAQSDAIATRGFAGFFGVSLDWSADGKPSARCPVLLKPGVSLATASPLSDQPGKALVKPLQGAPAAAFTFVEVLGLAYGLGLAVDALTLSPPPTHGDDERAAFSLEPGPRGGLAVAARVDAACAILKNLGLRRGPFARLILLCGHAGASANNPHAAGLDCGACGGHGGAINARVAAAILNDPAVRQALPARGWDVPTDVHFLPGVHNTTTDEVILLDLDRVPSGHATDLRELQDALTEAGRATRRERAAGLGLAAAAPSRIERLLHRRARDASEVRPEWALARNAAFVAARRARTRGVHLDGRAFLHEYDATTDPDLSILTLILSAPMVVASWINLQYFASTVDNRVFGCGTKTLHNRVGALGVVLGNGGDLRTGLAMQSVHAAEGRWYHEPLRLQVIVEANTTHIDAVLDTQPAVRALIDHGWVRLFALDPAGPGCHERVPGQGWTSLE